MNWETALVVLRNERNTERPNTIRLHEGINKELGDPFQILGMDVIVDENISPNGFNFYYIEKNFDVTIGAVYETVNGKFMQIKEITYFNSLIHNESRHIACIVTSGETSFAEDSKTTIYRVVYNQTDFRKLVRGRLC